MVLGQGDGGAPGSARPRPAGRTGRSGRNGGGTPGAPRADRGGAVSGPGAAARGGAAPPGPADGLRRPLRNRRTAVGRPRWLRGTGADQGPGDRADMTGGRNGDGRWRCRLGMRPVPLRDAGARRDAAANAPAEPGQPAKPSLVPGGLPPAGREGLRGQSSLEGGRTGAMGDPPLRRRCRACRRGDGSRLPGPGRPCRSGRARQRSAVMPARGRAGLRPVSHAIRRPEHQVRACRDAERGVASAGAASPGWRTRPSATARRPSRERTGNGVDALRQGGGHGSAAAGRPAWPPAVAARRTAQGETTPASQRSGRHGQPGADEARRDPAEDTISDSPAGAGGGRRPRRISRDGTRLRNGADAVSAPRYAVDAGSHAAASARGTEGSPLWDRLRGEGGHRRRAGHHPGRQRDGQHPAGRRGGAGARRRSRFPGRARSSSGSRASRGSPTVPLWRPATRRSAPCPRVAPTRACAISASIRGTARADLRDGGSLAPT